PGKAAKDIDADGVITVMNGKSAGFLPGEELIVRVETLAYGGSGVARADGFVIFIPGLVPGDRARVRIRARKPAFAEASLVELLDPSPSRIPPECPHVGSCGGCRWMHLPYETQLAHKSRQVVDVLSRIGGIRGYA